MACESSQPPTEPADNPTVDPTDVRPTPITPPAFTVPPPLVVLCPIVDTYGAWFDDATQFCRTVLDMEPYCAPKERFATLADCLTVHPDAGLADTDMDTGAEAGMDASTVAADGGDAGGTS